MSALSRELPISGRKPSDMPGDAAQVSSFSPACRGLLEFLAPLPRRASANFHIATTASSRRFSSVTREISISLRAIGYSAAAAPRPGTIIYPFERASRPARSAVRRSKRAFLLTRPPMTPSINMRDLYEERNARQPVARSRRDGRNRISSSERLSFSIITFLRLSFSPRSHSSFSSFSSCAATFDIAHSRCFFSADDDDDDPVIVRVGVARVTVEHSRWNKKCNAIRIDGERKDARVVIVRLRRGR